MEDLNSLQITKPQNEAMVQNHQPPVPQSPSMVEYIQVRSGDVRISTPDIHRLSQCVDTCTDTHMEVS
jgi:hypothetical protein